MSPVLDVRTLFCCFCHICVSRHLNEVEKILQVIEGDSDVEFSEDKSPKREDETGKGESSGEEDQDAEKKNNLFIH